MFNYFKHSILLYIYSQNDNSLHGIWESISPTKEECPHSNGFKWIENSPESQTTNVYVFLLHLPLQSVWGHNETLSFLLFKEAW